MRRTIGTTLGGVLVALAQWWACAAAQTSPDSEAMRAVPLKPGETLVLDGTLSHPAWQRAPVFDRFVERDPVMGAAPAQSTRVQLLFDDRALYVGVTALESDRAQICAPLVRPDGVNRTQDFVAVYIDAIGSKRSAQMFRISAAGSRADGMHTASDDFEDFSPDFDWDSAVAHHAQGWTAVFRLPFASLRFAPGEHDWRIMVLRRLPREQFHLLASVPIPRELPSFIDNMQPLRGVQLPADSRFVTLRPSLTLRRDSSGDAQARSKASASLDAKWRPLPEAVIDATLNPDFSQLALDVPQLSGNSHFALFYPEKRPFFFESADLLRTPTEAFYTRSFTEPRWGLRGTWRSTSWAGTALALDDRGKGLVLIPRAFGTDVVEQPASRVLALRLRSDDGSAMLPQGLQLGAVAALRRYSAGLGDNQVLGPDVAWQINDLWRLRGQWLHAETSALPDGSSLQRKLALGGNLLHLRLSRQDDRNEAHLQLDDIGSDFRHDSGFVNQAGVRKAHAWLSRSWNKVGPFNQLWLNAEWDRVTERSSGQLVSEFLRPGVVVTGASNLEWWTELHAYSHQRPESGKPLLHQRYIATGLVVTPARWFPMLDTHLEWGQMADAQAHEVRPGGNFKGVARLRPLAPLELDVTVSTAWLRKGGQRSYAETAVQGLAVWHFNARHNLRAIVEQTSLSRRAEGGPVVVEAQRGKDRTTSFTYTWRESSGTLLYAGFSSAQDRLRPGAAASRELFVKLQFDVDEVRGLLRRR